MPDQAPYLFSEDTALTNLASESFTVAGWFRAAAPGPVFVPLDIFVAPDWRLSLLADGTLKFSIFDSLTGSETEVVSGVITSQDFDFFAVRYDKSASTISITLDEATTSVGFTHAADHSVSSYSTAFQLGTPERTDGGSVSAAFDLDSVTVWGRAVTDAELNFLFAEGEGTDYPFTGGAFNLVFQGNVINSSETPLVLGSDSSLWAVTRTYDSGSETFQATLDLLYAGNKASQGYSWSAENFNDKIVFAQRDNRAKSWTPPLPNIALDLPGLPSGDAQWDGVTSFAGHVLLWRDDRLKWSDLNDLSLWLPVAETAVSSVFALAEDFIQPPVGGKVAVTITNPVAAVRSISLSGDLAFSDTVVGETDTALLTITNTGTSPLNVTGVSLPDGFSGDFVGTIPTGGAQSVLIVFTPTEAISYGGIISVASDATTGTSSYSISGTGTGETKIIRLSGVLEFSTCKIGRTLASSLIIENQGNATVTVASLTMPTGFSGSFSGTVAAGEKQVVEVTFSPTTALAYSGEIVVVSDATGGDSTFAVSGTGVHKINTDRMFITDNGSLSFGDVAVGETATGTLRIYNPRADAFKVVGLTLPTGFSGSFSGNVPATDYVDVTISFSPTDARGYSGTLYIKTSGTVRGTNTILMTGSGVASGKVLALAGSLVFGNVPVNGSTQALLRLENVGTEDVTVSSISYPTGFSGAFSGVIVPGEIKTVLVTFTPTNAIEFTGNLTVNSDTEDDNVFPVSGTGFDLPQPAELVEGQYVYLEDKRGSVTYYNYYSVVSMDDTSLVLKLEDLTGATPPGNTLVADGRQFLTVDANEAGETRVIGAHMNGPIFRVIPQGDYAYSFKERSVQSIQYTGLGNGTFFIHNEISGEGLISREALLDRGDGTMIFLGHKELYAYQGGPAPIPVCQQFTRQLYSELDRTRLHEIRLFHNENRKEIWVQYPVSTGFRVLIWNYVEDSASVDDYSPELRFTALGLVDWSSDVVWSQLSDATSWNATQPTSSWDSMVGASVDHVPLLASQDGNVRIHGLTYSRDGEAYRSLAETMDFDLGEPDVWKYVDVVVLGLEVKVRDTAQRYLTIQVGTQAALSGGDITWTAPEQVLVNGQAPVPVKINPGGAGRYLRLRFLSEDADVQWRISSFEIHCRPGGFY